MMSKQVRIGFRITTDGPKDQSLLTKTEESFGILIEQVRKIAQAVRESQVQQVARFILENLYMRIIEQQKPDTIFVGDYKPDQPLVPGYKPTLPIAFFIERVPTFARHFSGGEYAYFMCYADKRATNEFFNGVILTSDPSRYTPLFQAVNLFHEAQHALDHRWKRNYASLDSQVKEVPAHLIEILIMMHYGGQELLDLTDKYAERIWLQTGLSPERCKPEFIQKCLGQYEYRLDLIFGKAASPLEENLRMDRFIYGFVCNPLLPVLRMG